MFSLERMIPMQYRDPWYRKHIFMIRLGANNIASPAPVTHSGQASQAVALPPTYYGSLTVDCCRMYQTNAILSNRNGRDTGR